MSGSGCLVPGVWFRVLFCFSSGCLVPGVVLFSSGCLVPGVVCSHPGLFCFRVFLTLRVFSYPGPLRPLSFQLGEKTTSPFSTQNTH